MSLLIKPDLDPGEIDPSTGTFKNHVIAPTHQVRNESDGFFQLPIQSDGGGDPESFGLPALRFIRGYSIDAADIAEVHLTRAAAIKHLQRLSGE